MLEYKNIYIERPLIDRNDYMVPHTCRLGNLTYSGRNKLFNILIYYKIYLYIRKYIC